MQIEHEGYIEVQPVYTHVGYLSAAYDAVYAKPTSAGSPMWLFGVGALMLALGLRSLRLQGFWARVVALVLLAGALVAGMGAAHVARTPRVQLIPEFYQTLYNLELARRDTDRMVGEFGRTPTEEEWQQRMVGKPYARDGWGHLFEYQPTKQLTLNWTDGKPDRIVAVPARMTKTLGYTPTDRLVWDIGSDWLGTDGVLGTKDDYHVLAHHLRQARWTRQGDPNAPLLSQVEVTQR